MKNKQHLLLITIGMLLSSCSSGGIQLYEGPKQTKENISIIKESCDKVCKGILKDAHSNRFKSPLKASISYPELQVVDGKLGPNDFPMNDCGGDVAQQVYNDFWVGGYNIELKPGAHVLGVKIQQCAVKNRTLYLINVSLKKGHEYILGQVSERQSNILSEGKVFNWYPFLYDKTDQKVTLYNTTDSGWLKQ